MSEIARIISAAFIIPKEPAFSCLFVHVIPIVSLDTYVAYEYVMFQTQSIQCRCMYIRWCFGEEVHSHHPHALDV